MTKINRLTQIPTLEDSDLAVVWQDSSERTRAITIANLRKFIQSTDPNADAFTQVALEGDELVFISHGEEETRVDINLLPSHSVTELKDMPNNLIAGQYIKVNDDGTGFVFTPASEISAEILVQNGEDPAQEADVIKFSDGLLVSVDNKIALVKSNLLLDDQQIHKIYTERSINTLIEDGVATLSFNNDISPWAIHKVGIGDSPYVIESVDQLGIEYQYEASSQFTQSMILNKSGLPDGAQVKVTVFNVEQDSKPIYVTQFREGKDFTWPVSTPTVFTLRDGDWRVEESSQLLHIQNATTFDDDAALKQIIHGVAVDPSSPITMEVNDDGVLIIGGGGTPESPTFKSVNIDTAGSGNPNFTASIHQDGELHTVIDATRELRVKHKDIGTGATTNVMSLDNSQAQFLVPIMQGVDPVALEKDIPTIPDNGYIEKYSNADLNRLQLAYEGKYGNDRVHYPVALYQDVNGWTQFHFTGNTLFKSKNKSTGEIGDKVLDLRADRVVHHKQPYYGDEKLALEKDIPTIPDNGYIEKYTRADTDYVQIAYQGKYGDDRVFHPAVINQGLSGRTNFEFTYELQLFHKDKDTGDRDPNPVFTVKQNEVDFFKPVKIQGSKAASQDDVTQAIADDKAKGIWIGGVKKNTLTDSNNSGDSFDCPNPKHWIEFKKTSVSASQYLLRQTGTVESSEISIHLHPDSGLDQLIFRVATSDGKYMQRIIRSDEKWRFFAHKGDYPYFEKIDDGSNPVQPGDYIGQGLAVPKATYLAEVEITQTEPVGHYFNSLNQATTDGKILLSPDDGYKEFRVVIDGNTRPTRDYKISLGIGNKYSTKRVRMGEIWECRIYAEWDDINQQNFFWTRIDNGSAELVSQEEFQAKSGYNRLISGGGSTHTITYSENGSILKISNPEVKVQLLEGMSDENPHGYIKYINSHNADVAFEWYDRNGNQVTSNVPSVCPADTVVEIFADYAKDQYVLNFGQSKVIQSINEDDELREGLASGVIYAKTVTIG